MTVAQEHLCGEVILADFDRLDLSNLNRLQAGVDELGLRKTTIVARRIARIDPYLTVTVFEDGVTSSNLATFLAGLDLLIEECDGLPIKHEVRLNARALGVNVVYAADERGFLSVAIRSSRAKPDTRRGRSATSLGASYSASGAVRL